MAVLGGQPAVIAQACNVDAHLGIGMRGNIKFQLCPRQDGLGQMGSLYGSPVYWIHMFPVVALRQRRCGVSLFVVVLSPQIGRVGLQWKICLDIRI